MREAMGEASRAKYVFRWAGEQAKRMEGSWIPFDTEPGIGNRGGLLRRFPIGPVLAITPFNFPLNLVAHKVAPAIAAGCSIVLKPAPQTPLTALKIGQLAKEAGYDAFSVIPTSNEVAEQ